MRAIGLKSVLGALLLTTLCTAQEAAADDSSCDAVRRTRAMGARRRLDLGEIERLEQIECSGDYQAGGGGGPRRGRGGRPIDDEEFDNTVMGAIRRANRSEEANVCRFYARITRVTSAQVRRIISGVARSNEADCALAFFPQVVDPLQWETVYAPMSAGAERTVRATLGQ